MSSVQRLNVLYEKAKKHKVQTTLDLARGDEGYMYNDSGDWVKEFSATVSSFMNKYDIGKYLSPQKWSGNRRSKIKKLLADAFTVTQEEIKRDKNQFEIYDDLKSSFGDDYSASEVAVVARTETARIRTLAQLLNWKEAGIERVRHKPRNDSKVSPQCNAIRGRVFEINYLLSNSGEKDRIPIHPNCRCRLEMVL